MRLLGQDIKPSTSISLYKKSRYVCNLEYMYMLKKYKKEDLHRQMMEKETKVVNRSWSTAENWVQRPVTGDWVAMPGLGSSVKPMEGAMNI